MTKRNRKYKKLRKLEDTKQIVCDFCGEPRSLYTWDNKLICGHCAVLKVTQYRNTPYNIVDECRYQL